MSNPLEELFNFAHQSYVRMEAEQLLSECLELEDPSLFNDMIEGLVLDGASSIVLLREVLEEVLCTKSLLAQEALGIRQDLMDALSEFGVYLPQLLYVDAPEAIRRIYHQSLHIEVTSTEVKLPKEDEALLEEICTEAGNRVSIVARRLTLVNIIEECIRDWIGSLAYEAARNSIGDTNLTSSGYVH
ncbi:MAG: hypothetical protein GTO18_03015 [Anaerolineales bacterium]|nr:hypothetical protein [Anaerolineales bacterium]